MPRFGLTLPSPPERKINTMKENTVLQHRWRSLQLAVIGGGV